MTLNVLRSVNQVFFRIFLDWNLTCFFMIRLGLRVFGEEEDSDKVPFSYSIKDVEEQHDL